MYAVLKWVDKTDFYFKYIYVFLSGSYLQFFPDQNYFLAYLLID